LLDSVEEELKTMGIRNWKMKVTGLGPVASNHKRGQGSPCTVAPGGGGLMHALYACFMYACLDVI
jgi:hypothetical protein